MVTYSSSSLLSATTCGHLTLSFSLSPLIIILNIRKKITDYRFFIYLCKCLAELDIIIIERRFSLFYSVFALHQHYCYQLKIKYIEPC